MKLWLFVIEMALLKDALRELKNLSMFFFSMTTFQWLMLLHK